MSFNIHADYNGKITKKRFEKSILAFNTNGTFMEL